MKTWRAFLGRSAEKRTGHASIDARGFDRDQPSRHYANRTSYRVRALKVTALMDVETLYITDIHCTTTKKHDAKIGPQVARRNAADLRSLAGGCGYDSKAFRDEPARTVFVPRLSTASIHRSITPTTPAWTVIGITNDPGLKPSSRRSSARSDFPCVREVGTQTSEKWCSKQPSTTFGGASDIHEIDRSIPKLQSEKDHLLFVFIRSFVIIFRPTSNYRSFRRLKY